MADTRQQTATAVIGAIAETIEEMGQEGAPAGILYATVMDLMSLDTFNRIIAVLVNTGKVERSNNVLYWRSKRS